MAVFTRFSFSSVLHFTTKTLRSFPLVSCFKIPFNFPKFPSLKTILNIPEIPFVTYIPDSWTSNLSIPDEYIDRVLGGSKDRFLRWHFASGPDVDGPNGGTAGEETEVAVVILGWLGAEPHHLRSSVEMYNAKGIHAVTFVPSMTEVLVDSDYKMRKLASELGSWLSKEDSRRRRFLLFHTFGNTGWFGYGAILHIWNYEQDLLERIKGCVVDSGGYPNVEAKAWAAGFTTALLKECSFAADPSIETETGDEVQNEPKTEEKEPFSETIFASTFEEIFSVILRLEYVKTRSRDILIGLLVLQPSCPQLYLYSTEDKAVPYQGVESFIESQRRTGKQVFSFNFESSGHVDHFRCFPDTYSSQLDKFLKICLVTEDRLLKQG